MGSFLIEADFYARKFEDESEYPALCLFLTWKILKAGDFLEKSVIVGRHKKISILVFL